MSSEIVILDSTKCMSIQTPKSGKYIQCKHRKKIGEYCKKHADSKHLTRIDDSLKSKNIKYKFEEPNTLLIMDEDIYSRPIKKENNVSDIIEEQLIKLSGPAYIDICVSHDDVDIISLETLWKYDGNGNKIDACEFDKKLVFSYVDDRGFIRCFNIKSLKEILDRGTIIDPITGEKFREDIINNIIEKIKILEDNNLIKYEKLIMLPIDELKCKITRVFKLFDELDIWMEINWFLDLTIDQTIKIYEEIHNMWNAFSEDNPDVAKNVLNGKTPFNNVIRSNDIIETKNKLLDIFECFVVSGIYKHYKLTGAIIVIGGFAYVSLPVKEKFKDYLMYN